jgi:hypothetical protein
LAVAPELRSLIYEYVAGQDQWLVFNSDKIPCNESGSMFNAVIASHPLALTCRQLKHEYLAAAIGTRVRKVALVVPNIGLREFRVFREAIAAETLSPLRTRSLIFA